MSRAGIKQEELTDATCRKSMKSHKIMAAKGTGSHTGFNNFNCSDVCGVSGVSVNHEFD